MSASFDGLGGRGFRRTDLVVVAFARRNRWSWLSQDGIGGPGFRMTESLLVAFAGRNVLGACVECMC